MACASRELGDAAVDAARIADVGRADEPAVAASLHQVGGAVGRAVVDHDYVGAEACQCGWQRIKQVADYVRAIVGDYDGR